MVEIITSVGLPVDEKLMIKKNRIGSGQKRISIVTGIHGDELEGQYVCYELQQRIEQDKDKLKGIVDIYPAMNPLGIDSITRGIPAFDLDMNRLFPGNIDGNMTEYLAAGIIKDVAGSDCVLDIHASNIYLTEIPQIRINELHADTLIPPHRLLCGRRKYRRLLGPGRRIQSARACERNQQRSGSANFRRTVQGQYLRTDQCRGIQKCHSGRR